MEGSGNHNGNKGRQADVVYVQELSKGLPRGYYKGYIVLGTRNHKEVQEVQVGTMVLWVLGGVFDASRCALCTRVLLSPSTNRKAVCRLLLHLSSVAVLKEQARSSQVH